MAGVQLTADVLKSVFPEGFSTEAVPEPAAVSWRKKYLIQPVSGAPVTAEAQVVRVPEGSLVIFRLLMDPALNRTSTHRDVISAILDTAEAVIVVLDREGRFLRFNRAAERMTGFSEAEITGKRFWEAVLFPDDIIAVKEQFRELTDATFSAQLETRWRMKDGSSRTLAWANSVVVDHGGEPAYVVATAIDVTEFRQAETSLVFLSGQLAKIIEKERKSVSRFLHDTISQDLVALSLSLNRLQHENAGRRDLPDLSRSLELVDRCCREIRVVSHLLSPPVFREIGLVAALEWYSGQLRAETGVDIELKCDPLPPGCGEELESILFSTVQACTSRSLQRGEHRKLRISLKVGESRIDFQFSCLQEEGMPVLLNPVRAAEEFAVTRERLRVYNAQFEIVSNNETISLRIRVPLRDSVAVL